MTRTIELSAAALADLDGVYDFIASHDPDAAAKVLRSLDAAIELLVEQPRMGRVYRHGRRRLRLLICREYLVFYREQPGVIELVRVLHGKQNVPDILDEI